MKWIVELGAVIRKPLVKGWPMVARSFAIALSLLRDDTRRSVREQVLRSPVPMRSLYAGLEKGRPYIS